MNPTNFQHLVVQELAGVIQSPPLISGNIADVIWWDAKHCEQEYQACLPALRQVDQNPQALLATLERTGSHRLGRRFEALVSYWLQLSPNYELVLQQQVIYQGKQTVGELDFVIRDTATNELIHLEVAVKFYLGQADIEQLSNWMGPSLKDRLDLKFQHLSQRQTQLTKYYPSCTSQPIQRRACLLKGRLFYPAATCPTPPFATAQHLRGVHYRLGQTNTAALLKLGARFSALKRSQWLYPKQYASSNSTRWCYTRLPTTLDKAQCFIHWDMQGHEQQRLFLLPTDFGL